MKQIYYISLIIFMFLASSLYADFFNNRNNIPGDRASLMGGAYTAISDDVSGAYHNPAGLADMPSSSIYLNGSIYSYSKYTRSFEDVDLELNNLTIIPTTLGYAFRGDGYTATLSIFQLDNFEFSALNIRSLGGAEKVEVNTKTYLMGPSLGVSITDSLSIGASLFYQYFQGKMVISSESTLALRYSQNQVTGGGIVPAAGLKFTPSEKINIGLSYMMETYTLHGENKYTFSVYDGSLSGGRGEEDADIRLPHRVAGGIAFGDKSGFIVSADIIYYFPMEADNPHGINHTEDADYVKKERGHFDCSLGFDYAATAKISVRGGFFTNTSGAKGKDESEKINMFGASGGVGFIDGDVSTNIGLTGQYGRADNENFEGEPVKWERLSIGFVFGGSKKI